MALRRYKPRSAARRFYSVLDFKTDLTGVEPQKSLLVPLKRKGGRNNVGRITSRFRGGQHKRHYRLIDFKRDKDNIPARVDSIEYDPNRTTYIALLTYDDGEKRYILAPHLVKKGEKIISGDNVDIKVGNCLPLKNMPAGTFVHNIEMRPMKGGQLARSAGSYAQLLGYENGYAILRVPSGEVRHVLETCRATIGIASCVEHENILIGKAGRSRYKGRRPHNRGVSMNPVDHPHGGGEGKTSGGRHPVSPWGQGAKGLKTRNSKRTDRFIVRRRKQK
ncbi:MAG: 50S ribosomal protein L2 [Deltaproteobacteria bacterium]|nr:50S ribosomal protein L2 [Deltaproteobacteria bacterium]